MNQTENQDLPYPDCNDPANGALELQLLAESVDAKLVPQFAAFRKAINRPGFVYSLGADQGGFTSGGTSGGTVGWDTIVYASGVIQDPGSGVRFYSPGYWMIGTYIITAPSGGSTVPAQIRTDLIYKGSLLVPLGGINTEQWSSTARNSGNGTMYSTVAALVRQEFDGTTSFAGGGSVSVQIFHENVASDMIVKATSRLWAFKMSELETS